MQSQIFIDTQLKVALITNTFEVAYYSGTQVKTRYQSRKKIINARQDKHFCLQGTDFVLMSFPWIIFFISSVVQ